MSRLVLPNADFSGMYLKKLPKVTILDAIVFDAGENAVRYSYNTSLLKDVIAGFGKSVVSSKDCICIVDVSKYVGKKMTIKAANIVASSLYACCFASYADLDYIQDFSKRASELSESESSGSIEDKVTSIERFSVSSESLVPNKIEKTIPSSAKYLIVSNASANLPNNKIQCYVEE